MAETLREQAEQLAFFNRLGKPSKKKLISRIDAYHGSSYLTMALSGKLEDHAQIDELVEILDAGIRATADDLVREGLWH
jgi:adenosylmethionine-8-amino-7-oxononanoate aminotransferase